MLPAGLNTTDTNRTEFFERDGHAMAFYNGRVVNFWELPQHIVSFMKNEMLTRPKRCEYHGIHTITDINERLEAYICKEFPIVDNTPYYDNGKTVPEVFEEDAVKTYGLSKRETEVLKLIGEGNLLPEVSRQLYIDYKTAERHSHNIKQKLKDFGVKADNIIDMIRFAIKTRLVDV